MGKRFNGRKISHGKKDLPRPVKHATYVVKPPPKPKKRKQQIEGGG